MGFIACVCVCYYSAQSLNKALLEIKLRVSEVTECVGQQCSILATLIKLLLASLITIIIKTNTKENTHTVNPILFKGNIMMCPQAQLVGI